MKYSVNKSTGIQAKTAASEKEKHQQVVLFAGVIVLVIIGLVCNFLFSNGNMPFSNAQTGQKADAGNLLDSTRVDPKSMNGAASSNQGYQPAAGTSTSGFTGTGTSGTGQGTNSTSSNNAVSGTQATSLNSGGNSPSSSPNNAGTGGVTPGNTVGDSSPSTAAADDGNSSSSGSGGSAGDSSDSTGGSTSNTNNSSALVSGVYSSSGVRLDR